MGLLSKLAATPPAKRPTDDVLLLHAMMLISSADGVMEGPELSMIEAYFNTLPEFDGKEFAELLPEANKIVARHGGLAGSVEALTKIEDERVRKKCFVLAVDLALSNGTIDEAEERMLEAIQAALGIDDALAERTIEILSLKYVR